MVEPTNEELMDVLDRASSRSYPEARAAVLARMALKSETLSRCALLSDIIGKAMGDLVGDRSSESFFTEDEQQQMSTFLGMLAAVKMISSDNPFDAAAMFGLSPAPHSGEAK